MKAVWQFKWTFISLLLLYQCSAINTINRQQILEGPTFKPYSGLKHRIAVLDFENTSSHGGEKFGSAISDRLITFLVKSGRFTVIERQRIDEIMQEQALGQSGTITDETVPRVGKLLGVDAIILGTVIEAEQETGAHKLKSDDDDGKNDWSLALKATVGRVKIAYRMVNVSTGEVILANTATGSEFRPGFGFQNKEFDFTDMFELDQTVIGFALRKAMNSMVEDIVNHAPSLAWRGKVVKVNEDNTLYFTPGLAAGIGKGEVYRIYREQPVGDDPALTEEVAIGIVRVHGFIGDKVARATILEGNAINRGDIVKRLKSKSSEQRSVE